jgi:hypothetical protein
MDVVGDPHIDNPSKWGPMFNPQAFNQSAAFTPRTNPKWFPGILGPGYKNMDITLAKFFQVTERLRLEFKMESYNLSNTRRESEYHGDQFFIWTSNRATQRREWAGVPI